MVTVRPDAQGQGIGRQLFEVVMDKADREGVKCYLESSKGEPNVRIYEKMGFGLVKEIDCADGGDVCRVCFSSFLEKWLMADCVCSCFVWFGSRRVVNRDFGWAT